MKQTTLWDVLTASKGLPPATPLAAIWGRKLRADDSEGYYEGTLPVTLQGTVNDSFISLKIWGNTGGVGHFITEDEYLIVLNIKSINYVSHDVVWYLDAPLEKGEYIENNYPAGINDVIWRHTENLYQDTAVEGTTYTQNGITFTFDDEKWTVTGTAAAYAERVVGSVTLPAGTYYLWGINDKTLNDPTGVRIRLQPISVVCNPNNSPLEFTLTEETALTVRLVVGNRTNANGTEFEPFIAAYPAPLTPKDYGGRLRTNTWEDNTRVSYAYSSEIQPEKVELKYKKSK